MEIRSFDDLAAAVRALGKPPRVAIAPCAEPFVLRAAKLAADEGVAEPVLVGDMDKARAMAARLDFPLDRFESVDVKDDLAAVGAALALFRGGRAELVMKGLVNTSVLLKAILAKESGLAPETGILSHVAVFESPLEKRLMILSDAGVNIRPNLQRKVEVVRNALLVAAKLGVKRPACALLAAVEKVNYPAMPATLDADMIAKMAAEGAFGEADVAGPLQLDAAVSPEAAAVKGLAGPVAGKADVLIAPDIESGNMIYKCLSTFAHAPMAGVVVGSRVPVVVPSRGDDDAAKFHSLVLAAYLSRR